MNFVISKAPSLYPNCIMNIPLKKPSQRPTKNTRGGEKKGGNVSAQ